MRTPAGNKTRSATLQREVAMAAVELAEWLKADAPKLLGQHKDDGPSIGHQPDEHTARVLRQKKADFAPSNEYRPRRVRSCGRRHLAQRPHGDLSPTPRCYSWLSQGHGLLRNQYFYYLPQRLSVLLLS